MAITFSIDNDRPLTPNGIQDLTLDQSSQPQTQLTTDKGNDIDLFLTGGNIDGFGPAAGLDPGFETFLKNLSLSSTALNFAAGGAGTADVEGASSITNFVTVTATNQEKISDLFFSVLDDPTTHNQILGMQTLLGEPLYLHVDPSGNYATLTTASLDGGRIVAAFGLYAETIASDLHSGSAGVQMVTFEAIKHPINPNPDDTLSIGDVLQIGASASLSFNFDNLPSGSFLYAAVGSSTAALLVTGQDLNVNDVSSKKPSDAKVGDMDTGGKDGDPSDTVNTSQGGIGATIGINSQHFTDASVPGGKADGAVGVFTLVKDFKYFDATINGVSEGTGTNVNEIDYGNYFNVPSAKIFVSQVTGSSPLDGAIRVTLWEAGGGALTDGSGNPLPAPDHAPQDLKPEVGYLDTATTSSYIGDQGKDSHLRDDTKVMVGSVTVERLVNGVNTTYTWTAANSGALQDGNLIVTITQNGFTVQGLKTSDTLGFAAVDDPLNALDGTFNRFDVQALANSNPVDFGRIDLTQGVLAGTGLGSHLFIDDDGPSITGTITGAPTPTVDESNFAIDGTGNFAPQFSPVYGADGQAATPVTYALSTPGGASGLTDTATGESVVLSLNSSTGNVEGKTATTGQLVFVVSVSSAGVVTLDERRAVVHADATDPNDSRSLSSASLVVLTATAHNKDGDTAFKDLNIGTQLIFQDDGPAIGPISDGVVDFAKDGFVTKSLLGVVGADGKTSPYTLTDWTGKDGTAVSVAGVTLKGVPDSTTAATSVTYWADTNNDTIFGNSGDTAYYRLDLSQTANAGAGSYTFTVLVPPPPPFINFDFKDLPSGQNMFGCLVNYDSVGKQDLDGVGLFVVGRDANMNSSGAFQTSQALNSETINTSKGGGGVTIGVENQMFDQGEGAVFVYLKNPDDKMIAPHNVNPSVGPVGGLTQNTADDGDTIGFADTQVAKGAEIQVVQKQGSEVLGMKISAFDVVPPNSANDGTKIVSANDPLGASPPATDDVSADGRAFADNPLNGAAAVNITAVQVINRATGAVVEAVVNNNGTAVNVDDGSGPGKDADNSVNDALGVVVTFSLVAGHPGIYTATVTGFDALYTIAYQTSADHDAALVECTSGKWDVGGFNLQSGNDTPDQTFQFTAKVTDGDGDNASDTWLVGIDGTGAFDNGAVSGVSPAAALSASLALDPSTMLMAQDTSTSLHTAVHMQDYMLL